MYRIELKPGEENVFRTIEELAIGIRNGLVTPRARIFHNASQKWLPIEFHPHYKKALQTPRTKSGENAAVVVASRPAPAPVQHAPAPSHKPAPAHKPAPVHSPAEVHKPAHAASPALAPIAVVSPVVDLPPISYDEHEAQEAPLPVAHAPIGRATRTRFRPLYLAVAAAVLIVGTYVALSAATPARKLATTASEPPVDQPAEQPTVAATPSSGASVTTPFVTGTATSGPTFGPRALPPASAKPPMVTSAGASPAVPTPKDSAAGMIEPAPVQMDVSLPSLPSGDSLAPVSTRDSNAIRQILRAVSGKEASPRP